MNAHRSMEAKHVFLSYMREDEQLADVVDETLRRAGIKVWRDREALNAGLPWEKAIDNALDESAYFVACVSTNFDSRVRSGMRAEIRLAIKKLEKKRHDQPWFIPVFFDQIQLPKWKLGDGRYLSDLHGILLSGRWHEGLIELTKIFLPDERVAGDVKEEHFDTPSRLLHEVFPYYTVQYRWRALYNIYRQIQEGNGQTQVVYFRELAKRGIQKIVFAQLVRLALDTYLPNRDDEVVKHALTMQVLGRWDTACKSL